MVYSLCLLIFRWYTWWEKSGYFSADAKSSKPPFAIVSVLVHFEIKCSHNLYVSENVRHISVLVNTLMFSF